MSAAWSAGAAARALSAHVSPRRVSRLRDVAARRLADTVLLLENLSDARNLSACLRTADALGVHHVLLVERWGCAALVPSVDKGVGKWLALRRFAVTADALQFARRDLGCAAVVATALAPGATPLSRAVRGSVAGALPGSPRPRVCLAFGSEHRGVSAALRAAADACVYVPQAGFVESFNVSVAVGIVASAFCRRTPDYEEALVESRGGGLVTLAAAPADGPLPAHAAATQAAPAAPLAGDPRSVGPHVEHLGAADQEALLLSMLLVAVPNAEKILERKGLRPPDL
jgi:tRNA G18 (ribose-2'-O)-methylase SpoU